MTAEIISSLLMLVGGITILTNIIVQVVKSITWDKIPTNLVALFVSEALTLALGGAYASVKGIDIAWYMVAAAIVVGLMSAYAAMFGFDKFKEAIEGDFSKLTRFMERAKEAVRLGDLNKYGRAGVAALSSATPVDSGETAASWYYEITNKNNTITISFHNSNIQNGVPIAILLQYGHGTGTGGWVQGRDYINPAIQPIFDQIAEYAWKEVTRS